MFSDLILSKQVRKVKIDEDKIKLINKNILFVNKNPNLLNLYFNDIEWPHRVSKYHNLINFPKIDKTPYRHKPFLADMKK